MKITYDPIKRRQAVANRGLDFEDAREVFAGETFEFEDTRQNYGEKRVVCVGFLRGRMVIVGYVERGRARHVFSMRKANEREAKRYRKRFAQS